MLHDEQKHIMNLKPQNLCVGKRCNVCTSEKRSKHCTSSRTYTGMDKD